MAISTATNALRAGCFVAVRLLASILMSAALLADAPATNAAARPRLRDSISYTHDVRDEGPWSIQVIRVARNRADLNLHVTLGRGSSIGKSSLSSQMEKFPKSIGRPLVAVNGDYFVRDGTYAGDPEGLCIVEGELVSAPSEKTCMWVAADGSIRATNVLSQLSVTWPDGKKNAIGLNEELNERPILFTPAIGAHTRTRSCTELVLEAETGGALSLRPGETLRLKVAGRSERGRATLSTNRFILSLPDWLASKRGRIADGELVEISTATIPDLRGARTGISGGPALIRGGKATDIDAGDVRDPRTAIGWNDDYFFFVQVDGRRPRLSVGMTLPELTSYMIKLGCTEALNMDGGGSSTFWAQGQIMNNPSEGDERTMGNALLLSLDVLPSQSESMTSAAQP